MIIGNRIPYEYFLTKGHGESDIGSPGLPYEIGSYDAALTNAGIQNVNIIEYTSIIPKETKEIPRKIVKLEWGQVLECIKSQMNGRKGSFISAGLMTTDIYKNGIFLGGLACEYAGSDNKRDCAKIFEKAIKELVERRGFGHSNIKLYKDNITSNGYVIHPGKHFIYESMLVKKKHGTVLAAICFVSYKLPLKNKKLK